MSQAAGRDTATTANWVTPGKATRNFVVLHKEKKNKHERRGVGDDERQSKACGDGGGGIGWDATGWGRLRRKLVGPVKAMQPITAL